MNLPPQPVEANLDLRIARGLEAIQNESSFSAFLNYQRPGGSDDEREVAAKWLRTRVPDASAERLVVYPGNQAILFNALMSLTSPGDVVLTEALTFPGMKAAAEKLRVRLVGVALDEEGILPDALKAACKEHKPKAVYLIPTLHNPTTATLGSGRRKMIADIIRKNGLFLIEDDAYGLLEPTVSPIANLIPERTYLAVGLSKCIAPALRVSYLLAPDSTAEQQMTSSLQATTLMTPPLMVALVTHWLRSGVADKIIPRDPQRGHRPPATGPQVPERNFVCGEAEWTSSLAVVAAPVESCGVSVPCPSAWLGGCGRRCIHGGESSIAGRPRFAWGRAQPCRACAGATIPCRYAEIFRPNRSDCLESALRHI
jgi:Aminotransferase class I and II